MSGVNAHSLFLGSHTARGTKCRHDGCSHRCNNLHDEFKCLSLCHDSHPFFFWHGFHGLSRISVFISPSSLGYAAWLVQEGRRGQGWSEQGIII